MKWGCEIGMMAVLAGVILLLSINSSMAAPRIEPYFPESKPVESLQHGVAGPAIPDNTKQSPEIFVQMGHISGSFSYTNALSFLHDGNRMVSGNGDRTVKIWQTKTGREERTLRCRDDVTSLSVSQDGVFIVTGDQGHEKNVNLWDLSSGKLIKSFDSEYSANGHPVLFCTNEKAILAGGGQEIMTLWDIESGRMIRSFKANSTHSTKPDVSSIVLTPDGKTAIAANSGDIYTNLIRLCLSVLCCLQNPRIRGDSEICGQHTEPSRITYTAARTPTRISNLYISN